MISLLRLLFHTGKLQNYSLSGTENSKTSLYLKYNTFTTSIFQET